MERAEADVVIAEGCESGGHVGELTTITLFHRLKKQSLFLSLLSAVLLQANRHLAALALGADGFQVEQLLSGKEAPIHPNYKESLYSKDTGTVVTGRIAGTPVRILKNKCQRLIFKKKRRS